MGMPELCDIHNHLLPEVDDGCTSFSETLGYLREFRSDGVTDLVFSPHLMASNLEAVAIDEVLALHRERFAEVRDRTCGDASVPRLHLGQETLLRVPADVDKVIDRDDVGLAGGDALLVEFGFQPGFDGVGVIERLIDAGRTVIVAHPERYRFGDADPYDTILRWREAGASLQVNGGSLGGHYTETSLRLSLRLFEDGLIDMVSTDHHGDFRAHSIGMIAETVSSLGGDDAVAALMSSGTRRAVGSALTR